MERWEIVRFAEGYWLVKSEDLPLLAMWCRQKGTPENSEGRVEHSRQREIIPRMLQTPDREMSSIFEKGHAVEASGTSREFADEEVGGRILRPATPKISRAHRMFLSEKRGALKSLTILLSVSTFLSVATLAHAQIPAFPGADGYGGYGA